MSETGTSAGHVFVSYVREDSHHVDRLEHRLLAAGIPVWRDTSDLRPGEDWRMAIRRAITESALVFLACFSKQSVGRGRSYQNEELRIAFDEVRLRRPGDVWFIPVRFDECEIPDYDFGGGRTLASIQRADLFGSRSAESTTRLVAAILQILRRESGAGALLETGADDYGISATLIRVTTDMQDSFRAVVRARDPQAVTERRRREERFAEVIASLQSGAKRPNTP